MYKLETQILEFTVGVHRVTGIPQLEARSKSGNLCLPDRAGTRQPKPGERWECRPKLFLAPNLIVVELITRFSPQDKPVEKQAAVPNQKPSEVPKKQSTAITREEPREWQRVEKPKKQSRRCAEPGFRGRRWVGDFVGQA